MAAAKVNVSPDRRLLYWPEVVAMVGMSRKQLERLETGGRFPQRVVVGLQKTAFYRDEIEDWLTSLARVPK